MILPANTENTKNILALESSCDETACAVVRDGRQVLSSVVASQVELHARYGGVVPELASRAHIEAVNTVIERAMDESGIAAADISAVAVTNEPGLIGSLLVALMAAKTLAWVWDVPLVGVNHIHAHAYAPALDAKPIEYPAVGLICSGGHTALYHCMSPTEMKLLGSTIDDAAGEAFDKVAGILNLGYPGGPVIDAMAANANGQAVKFPRPMLRDKTLDFSFSGLKTAVLYHVNGPPTIGKKTPKHLRGIENFTDTQIADIAASFQQAAVDVLRAKLDRAMEITRAETIIIGGGVAANSALRAAVEDLSGRGGYSLRMPELQYCVDNAAMVAGLGYYYLKEGKISDLELQANATVRR